MGWEGIGTAIGVISDWFSPKQKIARAKNELDKLEREKSEILIHKASEKFSNRLDYIEHRLSYLNGLLKNQT